MKRLLILSVLLLLVMFCFAQSGKTIKVAQFIHPPFVYQDSQGKELKGAEIEYIKTILNDLGYQVEFIIVPFPRMLNMLESGDADFGPFLTKTAKRETFAYYSSKSVLTMVPVIVVLKGSPLKKLRTPDDLKGLKIGFAVSQNTPAFFKDSGLPPFDLATGDNLTEQNLKKLEAKRFDTFIELNPYNVRMVAKNLGLLNTIQTIDIPGDSTKFYALISKKSNYADDILKGINSKINLNKYDFKKYLEKELK